MTNSQPDFSQLFCEHFRQDKRGVTYAIRYGPHALHDMAFLSSLIHDARFTAAACVREGAKFTIPLERDRWEWYDAEAAQLESCPAVLLAEGVVEATWSSGSPPAGELWIDYLWLDESFRQHDRDTFFISLVSEGWRLRLDFRLEDFALSLQDLPP